MARNAIKGGIIITEFIKQKKEGRAYEQVLKQIQDLILNGDLIPGDRLLSERELADKLEVSRTSLREALKALEMLGVVEVRAGGTYIKTPDKDSIIKPLALALVLDRNNTYELLEVRKMIETQAAKTAAVRRNSDDLIIMKQILKEMKVALDTNDLNLAVDSDYKFHWAISSACHNKVLTRVLSTISDLFREVLIITRKKLGKYQGMNQDIYGQHLSIYNAIKTGDSLLAETLVKEHLESLEMELRQIEMGEELKPTRRPIEELID